MPCAVSLICLLLVTSKVKSVPVTDTVNQGFKYFESLYNQLEHSIGNTVSQLQQKAAGAAMGAADIVDGAVSRALVKVQGLREDCRIPAELSLSNLKDQIILEIGLCAKETIEKRLDSLQVEGHDLMNLIRESSNRSSEIVESCLKSETAALENLQFDQVGSCEFQTGISISQRFVDDAAAVQKYVLSFIGGTYKTTGTAAGCFKQDSLESLIYAIIVSAEKCQKRLKSAV